MDINPFEADKFSDSIRQKEPSLRADSNRSTFHKIEFLQNLDYSQKNKIWDISQQLTFEKGDIIIDFNCETRGIYFLTTGSIEYYKKSNDIEQMSDSAKAPTVFGELWLMVDLPTKVKIIAKEHCVIYLADRESFNDLLDKNGAIARKLYKRFTERLINKFIISDNDSAIKKAS